MDSPKEELRDQYEGRQTYATNMFKAAVPMKVAVDMMRHVDERMFIRHYQHTDAGDLKRQATWCQR